MRAEATCRGEARQSVDGSLPKRRLVVFRLTCPVECLPNETRSLFHRGCLAIPSKMGFNRRAVKGVDAALFSGCIKSLTSLFSLYSKPVGLLLEQSAPKV
jgi:hypothetical protein